ncbi:MAG: UvrD-helicase domain-containing protein [Pirellulales bacterium]|nr:UvrD-helicase domain-containing protein [Pirellulales bacterium]
MLSRMLDGLTDAQREAVTHFEGPLLILAGPGSGKTRVVTHRVAWLLGQDVPGRNILALTFTNKAADEMGRRIERLAGDPSVWVGTFHRFCARLLRKYAQFVGLQDNYTIYDVDDGLKALRQAIARLKIDKDRFSPETIAKGISWAKNNLISPEQYQPRPGYALGNVVQAVYPLYQRQLAASNAADFDDLLYHVAAILRENPEIRASLDERYRFVLVDEYQDTNLAQYAIARALSVDYPNLAVTGDPDQSIYGWRGANLNNILEFERDYPKVHVVRLEQNYRSTQRILGAAASLIAHNVRRKEKGLFTENGPGAPVRLTTYATGKDESQGIAAYIFEQVRAGRRRPRDFAVFYRINALSRSLEFALRELGIPYQMVNGLEFFQRKEIKDVLAYLHLLNNPRDEVALLRVINTPPRGIGRTTIDRLSDYAARNALSLLEAARRAKDILPLGTRPAALLTKFVQLFDRLAAAAGGPIEEIVGLVLSETGYQRRLQESEDEDDLQRLANIEELLTVARDFDERHEGAGNLEAFIEETSLVSDTDAWETEADRVTLMTLHASKGLEFPVVFITAVEEGLLPHERSRERTEQLEEERRLMFVGITRAQQELLISLARCRDFRGQRKLTVPSSFLMELPREDMDWEFPASEDRVDDMWDGIDQRREQWNVQEADEQIDSEAVDKTVGAAVHPPRQRRRDGRGFVPGLTTAAALANGGRPPSPDRPDDFRQGMLVVHQLYGLGRIAAISGSGSGRKATVDFRPPAGRKQFRLAEAKLHPLGKQKKK